MNFSRSSRAPGSLYSLPCRDSMYVDSPHRPRIVFHPDILLRRVRNPTQAVSDGWVSSLASPNAPTALSTSPDVGPQGLQSLPDLHLGRTAATPSCCLSGQLDQISEASKMMVCPFHDHGSCESELRKCHGTW